MTIKTDSTGSFATARRADTKQKLDVSFPIIIRARGVELTEKLRETVMRKVGRVRQYAPRAIRARVSIERDYKRAVLDRYCVTVRYEVPGNDMVAEHRAPEALAALDLVAEKIERRLRKRKTARLANYTGRTARACRIADYCGLAEADPLPGS